MNKVLLTQKDLTEALGMNPQVLNRWLRTEPNFPSYPVGIGKRRKYLLDEALAYLKEKDCKGNEES